MRTMDVLTVKVALVAPAGMITLEGTLAAPVLLLESATCAPPAGAGPLSVTVPVEDCIPPTTLGGFGESEEGGGAGGAEGATSKKAELVASSGAAANVEGDDIEIGRAACRKGGSVG